MTLMLYFFRRRCNPESVFSLRYCFVMLLFGIAVALAVPSNSFAFYTSKDAKSIHDRFDAIESLLQSLKKLEEASLRNQADLKSETTALHAELAKVVGLTEENNQRISESLENLKSQLDVQFKDFGELNRALFEEEQKKNEAFQRRLLSKLQEMNSKFQRMNSNIAEFADVYKTSTKDEMVRDNYLNIKMEEVSGKVTQMIYVYKDMALEKAAREESMITAFNKQLIAVNQKINQLVKIIKKSILSNTSSKTGLSQLKKELLSVNNKIKQLTEIYKKSIKENNAALKTFSNNLSKELQSINKKLPGPTKTKASTPKKRKATSTK